jgi:hypothetical protein
LVLEHPVAHVSELAGYLRQAEAVLAAAPRAALAADGVLAEPLERLRWFDLPRECLATPAAR